MQSRSFEKGDAQGRGESSQIFLTERDSDRDRKVPCESEDLTKTDEGA